MKVFVVGTGRSGTQYTAELLTRLKMKVGHEHLFHSDPGRSPQQAYSTFFDSADNWDVESSWCAVPYLGFLDDSPKIKIWHQLRDPIKVVDCWWTNGILMTGPPAAYVHRFLPECGMHGSLERTVRYVLRWTQMAAWHESHPGYVRYRLEAMTSQDWVDLLEEVHPVTLKEVETAKIDLSKNHSGCANHKGLTWDQVNDFREGKELLELYRSYGYNWG